jgi:alkylhydroperoxidase/carboxymuconolactone decarboxylase family protein YurZ
VNDTSHTAGEQWLRGLAAGDEDLLRSALCVAPAATSTAGETTDRLTPATSALILLAALLAAEGSTTSLHWAVERAEHAGAHADEVIEVLTTVAAVVGSARVVAAAPRLALAIGYDIEIEGWDGD